MNNAGFIFLTIVILLGIVFGAAFVLDKRQKKKTVAPEAPIGPVSRITLYAGFGFIGLTILLLVGALALREMALVKLAGSGIGLYILAGIIYRAIRSQGI